MSKFLNLLEVEQLVVTKEMTADVNFLVHEECDIVPKETRVVDFKQKTQKKKILDEMVSQVSVGTTLGKTLKTVDATGGKFEGNGIL